MSFADSPLLSGSAGAARQLVLIGVMSSPLALNSRAWQRHAYASLAAPGVGVRFVLGNISSCNHQRRDSEVKALLLEEFRREADMVHVDAFECSARAVATKTLAWYRQAVISDPGYQWIGKSDDDTLFDPRRLRAEALLMTSVGHACGQPTLYAYHGIMRYRLWLPPVAAARLDAALLASEVAHPPKNKKNIHVPCVSEVGCACGSQTDEWPAGSSRFVARLRASALQADGDCYGAVGPFPFAEGSLHMLTAVLVRDALSDDDVADFNRAGNWTHEDVGLAYMLLRASMRRRLPLMYFTLRTWMGNMRWLDLRKAGFPPVPDEHVLSIHRVSNAYQAEVARTAFAAFSNRSHDYGYTCHDCALWGWNVSDLPSPIPSWGYACCQRSPSHRVRADHRRIDEHLARPAVRPPR